VGTYILIFAGCGAALVNERLQITVVGIAIVSGLALTVAIYSVGHVSGGHFNPAVTIALAIVRKIQLKLVSNMFDLNILPRMYSAISYRVIRNFELYKKNYKLIYLSRSNDSTVCCTVTIVRFRERKFEIHLNHQNFKQIVFYILH
jgi:glycerol uptake facilitator-like aquaporin